MPGTRSPPTSRPPSSSTWPRRTWRFWSRSTVPCWDRRRSSASGWPKRATGSRSLGRGRSISTWRRPAWSVPPFCIVREGRMLRLLTKRRSRAATPAEEVQTLETRLAHSYAELRRQWIAFLEAQVLHMDEGMPAGETLAAADTGGSNADDTPPTHNDDAALAAVPALDHGDRGGGEPDPLSIVDS